MNDDVTRDTGATRRTPRGASSVKTGQLLATAFTALFILRGLTSGLDEGSTEIVTLFVLFGYAVACVLVAWWRPAIGALSLAIAGVALTVFFAGAGGDDRVLLALIFGGPYLLSALLLWFGSARLARA
jgi:hypothetical protein